MYSIVEANCINHMKHENESATNRPSPMRLIKNMKIGILFKIQDFEVDRVCRLTQAKQLIVTNVGYQG